MQVDEPIYDSATGWVADHIQTYVASHGQQGHIWRGMPTLLLTTRGRKSGQLRRCALIYGEDAGRYIIVGSNGAKPKNPEWYLNLTADPEVILQVGAETFPARARLATAEERPQLWAIMAQIFPTYLDYEKKAPREIPVVVLERNAAN